MAEFKRLTELLERFKADSGEYRDWDVPPSPQAQKRALRALMNVRPPRPMDPETLALQDEYLSRRAREKGRGGHLGSGGLAARPGRGGSPSGRATSRGWRWTPS